MQINNGIRSVLSIPLVYTLYQRIVFPRKKLIEEYIKPYTGQRILDIGCGTGAILKHLPQVNYFGIDSSLSYIEKAKKAYRSNEITFQHINIKEMSFIKNADKDIVLAIGVLHHIDDEECLKLFKLARQCLKSGGKLVAVEPCYVAEQSYLARWIISKDRGQNVKDENGYRNLASQEFENINIDIRHDLLRIPFTLAIIECFA